MVVRPFGLRACAAMLISAVVIAAGLGCKKSKASPTPATEIQVTGTITYKRVPLHRDANGVPTGLETDATLFTSVPARGLYLRVFQLRPQVNADYTTTNIWTLVATTYTTSEGKYTITNGVKKDYPTFVEVAASMNQPVAPASTITVVSDPEGVYSSRNILDRTSYVLRKALDGTTSTTDATHGTVATVDATLDFAVGLSDPWMVVPSKWWVPAQGSFTYPETVAAGSRIVAILDSCWDFANIFGNAAPSGSVTQMDLHYRPGVSTRRGTFVEFYPQAFPESYDGSSFHWFGSISAGGTVDGVLQSDDAFDVGVLYPILGRNAMYAQAKTNVIPTGFPTTSLAPDLALVEGFGDAMAVTLMKNPYLPGTDPGNRYGAGQVRDIRDLSGYSASQISAYSAPAITALTWELLLINAAAANPGNPTEWAKMTASNFNRFYKGLNPTATVGTSSTTTIVTDCVSLFTQLARLQEDRASGEASDLKTFFGDTVLTAQCAKFNVPWTTAANAILPKFTTNWGLDPDTLVTPLPSFTFSMAGATKVKRYALDLAGKEQASDYYPNNSKDEVVYTRAALSRDRTYNLGVSTIPALPEGAAIEVVIDGDLQQARRFPAGSAPAAITIKGNPGDLTLPAWHSFRIRMLSPTTLVSDTQVTIHLEKTNQ